MPVDQSADSKPPTTTFEQDLRSAGQRHINMIWESTQQFIAMMVVVVTLIVNSIVILAPIFRGDPTQNNNEMPLLANLAGIVIGFYFGRTNHSRIGDDKNLDDR